MLLKVYEVLERHSGEGERPLFRAKDTRDGRYVAMRGYDLGSNEPRVYSERIQKLPLAQRCLEHPAIAVIEDLVVTDRLYTVSPWLDGPSLAQILDRNPGPWPADLVFRVSLPIASALAFAHAHDVLHLDLHPDRIRFRSTIDLTHPVVTEFGLYDGLPPVRRVPYPAPELLRRNATPDSRADVFSAAMIVWRMLTGRLPVDPTDIAAVQRLYLGQEALQRPDQVVATAAALSRATAAALDMSPSGRPKDGEALVQMLRNSMAPDERTRMLDVVAPSPTKVPRAHMPAELDPDQDDDEDGNEATSPMKVSDLDKLRLSPASKRSVPRTAELEPDTDPAGVTMQSALPGFAALEEEMTRQDAKPGGDRRDRSEEPFEELEAILAGVPEPSRARAGHTEASAEADRAELEAIFGPEPSLPPKTEPMRGQKPGIGPKQPLGPQGTLGDLSLDPLPPEVPRAKVDGEPPPSAPPPTEPPPIPPSSQRVRRAPRLQLEGLQSPSKPGARPTAAPLAAAGGPESDNEDDVLSLSGPMPSMMMTVRESSGGWGWLFWALAAVLAICLYGFFAPRPPSMAEAELEEGDGQTGPTQRVVGPGLLTITSRPSGAEVTLIDSGRVLGTTPLELDEPTSLADKRVRISLPGLAPAVQKLPPVGPGEDFELGVELGVLEGNR